jgi:hypothetical protein
MKKPSIRQIRQAERRAMRKRMAPEEQRDRSRGPVRRSQTRKELPL